MTIALTKTEEMLIRSLVRGNPATLKDVSYEIEIVSGLVAITQRRLFRNDEQVPIEATMTFPVGYDSVVTEVRAVIEDRTLVGVAKARALARETYEAALDDGKAAVLHEELLRGLHMVSVGNVAPGTQIEVITRSLCPLALVDGLARVRVPLTIGAIYGCSPLLPSDDVVTGAAPIKASVRVVGAAGATVNGVPCTGSAEVLTSSVIELEFQQGELKPLSGTLYNVEFSPAPLSDAILDAAVLIDASGSMSERSGRASRWEATIAGLSKALARRAKQGDMFDFWTFSDATRSHGRYEAAEAARMIPAIPFAGRGTKLSDAVHKLAEATCEGNILLVTDGRSHTPIDFDRVRETGARFTVVLVGASSLDSHVAHLAALTGGQMFVVDGEDDVSRIVEAALASMRSDASPVPSINDLSQPLRRRIGGLEITVTDAESASENRDADAFAASLLVQSLPTDKAASLAEAAGIVSHLTSIVLVDEGGEPVEGIAVTRKVALATPADRGVAIYASEAKGWPVADGRSVLRGANVACGLGLVASCASQTVMHASLGPDSGLGGEMNIGAPLDVIPLDLSDTNGVPKMLADLNPIGTTFDGDTRPRGIDWDAAAEMVSGVAEALSDDDLSVVNALARKPEVISLGAAIGKTPVVVAIAILALRFGRGSRTASRITRKVLTKAPVSLLERAMRAI